MMEQIAWPRLSAVLLLLACAGGEPSAAQSPAASTGTTSPAPRPQPGTPALSYTPPTVNAASTPASRPPMELPPSAVSPAIERFLKLSGRDGSASPPQPASGRPAFAAGSPTRNAPPPRLSQLTLYPDGAPAAASARSSSNPLAVLSRPMGSTIPGAGALAASTATSRPVLAQRPGTAAPPAPTAPTGTGRPAAPNVPSVTPPSSSPSSPSIYVNTRGLPATGPTFLLGDVSIKPAPLEPTDLRFPISLATALRLSDARPLIVAAAQAGVWVAEAQLTRAKVLWVPTFIFGFDYIRHDGGGPDFNKGIMTAPTVNFYYGGASAALNVNLTDAYFEPLVQRQMVNAANYDVQTAKNDALFQTATAYFAVHMWRGRYAGALYTVERGYDLIEKIAQLSRELVPRVEVDRARNMLADLEQQATSARENWRVQSANLTQVLRLDPRAVVEPIEHDHLQVTLIDPARAPDDLMAIALNNRPEVASQQAQVRAAEYRIQREKMRPLLPSVQLNGFQSAAMLLQGGLFGIGPNNSLDQFRGRADQSFQLVWQLENFGVGNLARIKNQRGMQSRQIIDYRKAQDQVAADVFRALAHVQSAAARVSQADRALRTAMITFNGNLEGLGQTTRFEDVLVLVYRPQEAVYSLELMKIAFDEYFATVAEYNTAQFDLFHAMGYPARELAQLRPPGEAVPVDTARPPYLPPVGNGPPPATR